MTEKHSRSPLKHSYPISKNLNRNLLKNLQRKKLIKKIEMNNQRKKIKKHNIKLLLITIIRQSMI